MITHVKDGSMVSMCLIILMFLIKIKFHHFFPPFPLSSPLQLPSFKPTPWPCSQVKTLFLFDICYMCVYVYVQIYANKAC